jgi:hypothetical protein
LVVEIEFHSATSALHVDLNAVHAALGQTSLKFVQAGPQPVYLYGVAFKPLPAEADSRARVRALFMLRSNDQTLLESPAVRRELGRQLRRASRYCPRVLLPGNVLNAWLEPIPQRAARLAEVDTAAL